MARSELPKTLATMAERASTVRTLPLDPELVAQTNVAIEVLG